MKTFRVLLLAVALVGLVACQPAPQAVSQPAGPAATRVPPAAAGLSVPSEQAALGETAMTYARALASGLGPRDTQSGAEKRAADYLVTEFRKAGWQVRLQEFNVSFSIAELSVTSAQAKSIKTEPFQNSAEGKLTAPIVFAGLGSPSDLAAAHVQGKVALLERGQLRFQDKVSNASSAGAVGVIVFNNVAGPLFGVLAEGNTIPALAVTKEDGAALQSLITQGPVEVSLAMSQRSQTSQNVVAELPGSGTGTVVVGGHYDSVPLIQAADDNASGTAALLTLAHQLAGKQFPFTVQLVAFGGEELGLLGSRHYVASLPDGAKADIRAMLNLDVVGSKRAALGIGGDEAQGRQLAKSASSLGISLAALDQEVPSDHLSFLKGNIPGVILTTPDFENIHTPADTVDTLSPDRLGQTVSLVLRYLDDLSRADIR